MMAEKTYICNRHIARHGRIFLPRVVVGGAQFAPSAGVANGVDPSK
jgi:hypothetical protein